MEDEYSRGDGRPARLILAAVGAVLLASCARQPSAVSEQDVPGRYEGIALDRNGARPARLRLVLDADHAFGGMLPGGSGGYAVRTGRWQLSGGDAECRGLRLIAGGGASVGACLSRLPDGAVCLRWRVAASGCAMTKASGG